MRGDLLFGVGQLVERLELLAVDDVVLHRDDDIDEHVVPGFGLDLDVELLHPQRQPPGLALDQRQLEVEPGAGDPGKAAEALDQHDLRLLDHKEHAAGDRQHEDGHQGQNDQRCNERLHLSLPADRRRHPVS